MKRIPIVTRILIAILMTLALQEAVAAPRKIATNAPATYNQFGVLGDLLLYAGGPVTDRELWRADGTTTGTFLVKDIFAGGNSSNPMTFVAAGGQSFFAASDDTSGTELWKSGGTEGTTARVKDIVPGNGASVPVSLRNVEGTLYFVALGSGGAGVYRSDGTESGTLLLKDGLPPAGGNLPGGFTALNGSVVFTASDGSDSGRTKLWITDGTPADTQPVGASVNAISDFASLNGALFFIGHTDLDGFQLWRTDGTAAGTTQVTTLAMGASGGAGEYGVSNFLTVGSVLFFLGNDGSGMELWRTDGTPQGTQRVADICPGACGSSVMHMATVGGLLYFTAIDGVHGEELWVSDGTSGGTRLVKDIRPGTVGSLPFHLTVADGRLFFGADGGPGNSGLWVTDGTEDGTKLVAPFEVPASGNLFSWIAATSKGLFIAREQSGTSANELWFHEFHCSAGDRDGDGMPNCVEDAEGRDPDVKDNDVFADAHLFAMQQYRDFLGREGDAGGIGYWSDQIASGAQSRAQVIESFLLSAEFQGNVAPVVRLYSAYFRRLPDYTGLTFWIDYKRQGNSLVAISQQFAQSAEFTNRYGSLDNGQFVDLVYQNVLGRAPDAGGRAYWLGQLDAGTPRGSVMLAFSDSAEFQQVTANEVYVTIAYIGMMRRKPDQGGFDFWTDYLDAGNSGLALINGFLNSAEYRKRFLP